MKKKKRFLFFSLVTCFIATTLSAAMPKFNQEQAEAIIANCVKKLVKGSAAGSAKTNEIEAFCKSFTQQPLKVLDRLLSDCLPPAGSAVGAATPPSCTQVWNEGSNENLTQTCNQCLTKLTKSVPSDKPKKLEIGVCDFSKKSKYITLKCESWDYAYTECKLPKEAYGAKITDITVKEKESVSSCIADQETMSDPSTDQLEGTDNTLASSPVPSPTPTSSSSEDREAGNYGIKDSKTMYVDHGCRAIFNIEVGSKACGLRPVCEGSFTPSNSAAAGGGSSNPTSFSACQKDQIRFNCPSTNPQATASSTEKCKINIGDRGVLKSVRIRTIDKVTTPCDSYKQNGVDIDIWGGCSIAGVADVEICSSSCKNAGEQAASTGDCCKGLEVVEGVCQFSSPGVRSIGEVEIYESACRAAVRLQQGGGLPLDTSSASQTSSTDANATSTSGSTMYQEKVSEQSLRKMVIATLAKIEILGSLFTIVDEDSHKRGEKTKVVHSKFEILSVFSSMFQARHQGLRPLYPILEKNVQTILKNVEEYTKLYQKKITQELSPEEKTAFEKNAYYALQPGALVNLIGQKNILEERIAFNLKAIDVMVDFGQKLIKAKQVASNYVWNCAFNAICARWTWFTKSGSEITEFYEDPFWAYKAKNEAPIKPLISRDDGMDRFRIINAPLKENFMSWLDQFVAYKEVYDFTDNRYKTLGDYGGVLSSLLPSTTSSSPTTAGGSSTIVSSMNTRDLFDFYFKDKPVSELTKDSGTTLFCSDEKERGIGVPYGYMLAVTHLQELNLFLLNYFAKENEAMLDRIKCIEKIYEDAMKAMTQEEGSGNIDTTTSTAEAPALTTNTQTPGGVGSGLPSDSGIGGSNYAPSGSGSSDTRSPTGVAVSSLSGNNNSGMASAGLSGSNARTLSSILAKGLEKSQASIAALAAQNRARSAAITGLKAKTLQSSNPYTRDGKKAQSVLSGALNSAFPSDNRGAANYDSFMNGGHGAGGSGSPFGAGGAGAGTDGNGNYVVDPNAPWKQYGSGMNSKGNSSLGEYETGAGSYGRFGRRGGDSGFGSGAGGSSSGSGGKEGVGVGAGAMGDGMSEGEEGGHVNEDDAIWTKVTKVHKRHIKPKTPAK